MAKLRNVSAGKILFELGDRGVPFFVLLSGIMEIIQPELDSERLVARHDRAGEFTGEINMFSGQPTLVRSRVIEPDNLWRLMHRARRRAERSSLTGFYFAPCGSLFAAVTAMSPSLTPDTRPAPSNCASS